MPATCSGRQATRVVTHMKYIKTKASHRKRTGPHTRKAALYLLIGLSIFFAVGIASFVLRRQAGPVIPPYYDTAEQAMPFPRLLSADRFRQPSVVRAYSLANAIPDVFVQQPCFCGCARLGHKSLLSCFTSTHASHCRPCLKEAFIADRLHRDGRTAVEIRNSIMAGDWRNETLE